MKKRLIAASLALLMTASLCACGNSSDRQQATGNSDSTELPKVRIAILDQTAGVSTWYIHEQGWDLDAGFEMELSIFSSGAPANEAMAAGEVDIALEGGAAVSNISSYGNYSIAEFYSCADDINIIVRPDSDIMDKQGANPEYPNLYGTADTLRGKTILLPVGTGHHICALRWLAAMGLTEEDVSIVDMQFAQAYQAYIAGEGDVFICSYPYAQLLMSEGYQKAGTITDTNTPYYDNVVVSADFYTEEHYELLASYIELLLRAGDFFAENPDEYISLTEEYLALNGKDTSDHEALADSTLKSVFMTSAAAKEWDLGSGLAVLAEFQRDQGTITSEKCDYVIEHVDDTVWNMVMERLG